MSDIISSFKRDLFEIENARNLNPKELVETFVPTQSFWRLLSAKHHVVLGARGSGKTALARMLSHDHLAMLKDQKAESLIREQQFIGIYVPTRLEWVGALKNKPWQTDIQKEAFFQWKLNLSSCLALITTLESCIRCYCGNAGEQALVEARLAPLLAKAWDNEPEIDTLDGVRRRLQDIEYENNLLISQTRATGQSNSSVSEIGAAFNADLFVPLRRGITLASRTLNIRQESAWLVCVDEAEFLDEFHHRIINSLMRSYTENIFLKMTTMPYCHYTLSTNTHVSLDVGHDFEYVYIDFDPVLFARRKGEKSNIGTAFARKLFERRAKASGTPTPRVGAPFAIDAFLGSSVLLDEKNADWTTESPMMELLRKYCNSSTVKRAEELLGHPNFKPTISRKIHGALLLRQSYDQVKGRGEMDIYSGVSMAVRCGDANPRRLVRIFNGLLLEARQSADQDSMLSQLRPKAQTRVLRKLSTSYLERVQSEPEVGKELFDFLTKVGSYMRDIFHKQLLTTDYVSSIKIFDDITEREWLVVQRAVQLGLLFPNIGPQQRGELPNKEGTFHFAFILSPHFSLLPRRGHARGLYDILSGNSNTELSVESSNEQMEMEYEY